MARPGLVADDFSHPRPDDLRGPIRFLWWLVRSQGSRIVLAATLGTLWMVGLVVPPWLLSHAIDDGLEPKHYGALAAWAGALAAAGVLNAAVAITRHRTMTRVRMDGAFRTVHAVVEQATRLGDALIRSATAGELTTIGISDVWAISTSLTVVGPGFGAIVAYLVVGALLLTISPLLALVVLIGAPLLGVAVGPLVGRLQRVGADYREQQGALSGTMIDVIEGLGVLQGIGGEEFFEQRYRGQSARLRAEGYRVGAVSSWMPALGSGLPMLFLAVVTWLTARMAVEGTVSIGQLVAVYGYVAILVVPVSELIESAAMLSQSLVAARRVITVLRLPSQAPSANATPLPLGDLVDPESGVTVPAGRLTVLAGSDPAQALAVVDRLAGLRPSAATYAGQRLDTFHRRDVRAHLLVADNDPAIFAGTVRTVVGGRAEPADEMLRRALHTAAADDIVAGLASGLDSAVVAGGRNLSGGQRQRLVLARALAADPAVLLAVDPTSAVDAHTEALICTRLRTARRGRTTLVVSTSPPLLATADLVHWLVDGQVAASGSHDDLLAVRDDYRELATRGLPDDDRTGSPHV